jgi:hypothetical protein
MFDKDPYPFVGAYIFRLFRFLPLYDDGRYGAAAFASAAECTSFRENGFIIFHDNCAIRTTVDARLTTNAFFR